MALNEKTSIFDNEIEIDKQITFFLADRIIEADFIFSIKKDFIFYGKNEIKNAIMGISKKEIKEISISTYYGEHKVLEIISKF